MKSIFFVDRTGFYYYGGNAHTVLSSPCPPDTVYDFEVIREDLLEALIDSFITQNKLDPVEVGIIVSRQGSFEKTIPSNSPISDVENEHKKFIDNVPFEQILEKSISDDKNIRFVAINKDLAFIIKKILEKNNFTVEAISSIAAIFPQNDVVFSIESAQQLLKMASQIKALSFLLSEAVILSTDTFIDEPEGTQKKNSNLYLLVGFFVIAIIALVFLLLTRNNAKNKTKTALPSPTSAVVINPTLTTVPSPAGSTGSTLPERPKTEITFRILNGSGVPGQAEKIRSQLEEKSYQNITTGNSPLGQTSQTLIVVHPEISAVQRSEIVTIVEGIAGKTSVQENAETDVDVLITTSVK